MSSRMFSRASLVAAVFAGLSAGQAGAGLDPNAFTSLGSLNVAGSTLTFDTDSLMLTGGPLSGVYGTLQMQGSGNPDIAVFTFSDVLIGGGVTLQVTGSRPIAILSQSNLRIDADLARSGTNGTSGAPFGSAAPNGLDGQNGTSSASGGNGAPPPVAAEPGGKGGNGGYNSATGQAGSAGSGGAGGGPGGASSGNALVDSDPGVNGSPGAAGVQGASALGGVGAAGGGGFILRGGGAGSTGNAGTNGKGGGGGGGGGGGANVAFGFPSGTADTGGGGGSGGSGGSGGQAGAGGAGGGAIHLAAVSHVEMNGALVAFGGNGGNGAAGQLGGTGGAGGLASDSSGPGGPGGRGGDGGAGGAGGGGAGGTIYLAGAYIHGPGSPVNLAGGAAGSNPSGGVGGPSGNGLFRFDGTLVLDVSSSSHDQLAVVGTIDAAGGGIHFDLADDADVSLFDDDTLTLDSFVVENGGPVGDLTPYLALTYSATSPTAEYDVTLNLDRTFSFVVVPEPATLSVLVAGLLMTRRRR